MNCKLSKFFILVGIFSILSLVFGFSSISAQTSGQGEVSIDALVPLPEEEEEEEPSSPSGGAVLISDLTPPVISNIKITEISLNSVKISWKTNEISIPQINYGETIDYDKTFIGASFSIDNYIILQGFFPDEIYHFEIVAIDRDGNRASTPDQTFQTLPLPDVVAPANIADLTATAYDKEIKLKWQNPLDADLRGVRIFRSQEFFPINPESHDNLIVFDKKEEFFIDANIEPGKIYYYTAFSYDYNGNFSSGAFVAIKSKTVPEIPGEEEPGFEGLPEFPETPAEQVPSIIQDLEFEDFDFFQQGKKIDILSHNIINIEEGTPFVASIDYEKLPEVFKTIVVTLEKPGATDDENSKFFSFLLKVNPDKTYYLANIQAPAPGKYPITINILDIKNRVSKRISGILEIKKLKDDIETTTIVPLSSIYSLPISILVSIILILAIIFVLLLYIIIKRRRNEFFDDKNY